LQVLPAKRSTLLRLPIGPIAAMAASDDTHFLAWDNKTERDQEKWNPVFRPITRPAKDSGAGHECGVVST
jgi:hypothetical protein